MVLIISFATLLNVAKLAQLVEKTFRQAEHNYFLFPMHILLEKTCTASFPLTSDNGRSLLLRKTGRK